METNPNNIPLDQYYAIPLDQFEKLIDYIDTGYAEE